MKKEKLKHIIKKNIKQEPTKNFTQNIMQQVTEDSFLKMQLREGLLQQAPTNFTANLLKKLNPKPVTAYYQPVISKKIWGVIGILFMLLIFFSFNNSNTNVTSKYIDIIVAVFSRFNMVLQSFFSNNFLIMLILSISGLILIDSLLNAGKSIFKKV